MGDFKPEYEDWLFKQPNWKARAEQAERDLAEARAENGRLVRDLAREVENRQHAIRGKREQAERYAEAREQVRKLREALEKIASLEAYPPHDPGNYIPPKPYVKNGAEQHIARAALAETAP